ncbi:MAG: MaoC family dehydratase N-terminal domain-containing protein [Hyphomicrobiales bacterium]
MTIKVGTVLAEWSHPVEWGKVREFATAVHDPRAGAEPPVPPLTFPVVLTAEFVARFVREILPLDRQRTVHGEQEYEYVRPLQVGERVRCVATLTRDETRQGKRGGTMRLVSVDIEMREEGSGTLIGIERMTAVEQEAKP